MGLEEFLSVGTPLQINGNELDGMMVIVLVTSIRSIKVIYSESDSESKLSELLDEHNVPQAIKKVVLSSMGFNALSGSNSPNLLASELPGISLQVKHPETGKMLPLYNVIMNLNDYYKWSREKIADWIENVCDTKDISFKTPKGLGNEITELSEFTSVVEIKRVLAGTA